MYVDITGVGREVPQPGAALGRDAALDFWRHVGYRQPAFRGKHGELVGRLHVGLVEARVDAVRVEGLQVREQVDVAVRGVGEPVQPLAAARVTAIGVDHELVVRGEAAERDPLAVERVQADRGSVERDRVDFQRGEVDEGAGARSSAVKADP